jgi:hypothetical protein
MDILLKLTLMNLTIFYLNFLSKSFISLSKTNKQSSNYRQIQKPIDFE